MMSFSNGLLIKVSKLQVGYGSTPLIPSVSFEIYRGQVTSIVGHNGSGKSTLLKTLLGLIPKVGGLIHIFPETRIGYVPQRESMDPIYPIRVKELIETGRYGLKGVGRTLKREDRDIIDSSMEATGVIELSNRLFRTLSGGEQQKVLLARAYCSEPNVLILDEPTASMDEKGSKHIMEMTLELARKSGAAILMINHFLDLVADCSHQVILLDRENSKVEVGVASQLLRGRGGVFVR